MTIPDVGMVCKKCQKVTVVKDIIFLLDGHFEVQGMCGHVQKYGIEKK